MRNWRDDVDIPATIDYSEELDSQVVERRTNLWKMVLTQERGLLGDAWETPFTIASGLVSAIQATQHVLRPTGNDVGTSRQLPLQRVHISPHAIPSQLADTCVDTAEEMLAHLNEIFGTNVPFNNDLAEHFTKCVPLDWDVGTAYGYLRPWWHGYAAGKYTFWEMDTYLGDRRTEDLNLRHCALASTQWMQRDPFLNPREGEGDRIVNPELPPRRVWDLYSNRVLSYSALPAAATIPHNLWAVSHSWVDESELLTVNTSINNFQWPVPIPKDTSLDRLRIELLNLGAEYVFLDVLCLRQWGSGGGELLRMDEWGIDVPTLGYVYRYNRYQTTVVYFNGLGRPFQPCRNSLRSSLHWFNRAWTLQETTVNWLPGGLTSVSCDEWDGPHFIRCLREAQRDLGLLQLERPRFADLVHAMQRRPGYADKKPYDRVAALAYILPGHQPELYNERWKNAEEAWAALVRSLTGHERLDLLLYDMPTGEEKPIPFPDIPDASASIRKRLGPWIQFASNRVSGLTKGLRYS